MWHESDVSGGRVLVYAAAAITGALLTLGFSVALAFGQNGGGNGTQYSAICQNIIGEINVIQNQEGNAAAVAQYGDATAEVAQAEGVSIAQVNECLNGAADGPGGDTTDGGGTTTGGDTTSGDTTTGDTTGDSTTSGDGSTVPDDVIKGTIPDEKVLANTGGPAVLLPALGLLLLTSGVAALKVFLRR